jgi:hypothetical protein
MDDIFNKLIEQGLSPNTYYVLHCIKEKIVPASFVNKAIESKRLQSDQWVDENLELTSKSIIFMEEINGYFRRTKKKTAKDLMGQDFTVKIKEYVVIFPNRKLSSGKYARVNPKNLEAPFKWFFENYDYDWDIILQATQKYVREYEVNDFEFMRTAQYFIRKQNIDKSFESDLATYCELIKDNPDDEVVYFKERIL